MIDGDHAVGGLLFDEVNAGHLKADRRFNSGPALCYIPALRTHSRRPREGEVVVGAKEGVKLACQAKGVGKVRGKQALRVREAVVHPVRHAREPDRAERVQDRGQAGVAALFYGRAERAVETPRLALLDDSRGSCHGWDEGLKNAQSTGGLVDILLKEVEENPHASRGAEKLADQVRVEGLVPARNCAAKHLGGGGDHGGLFGGAELEGFDGIVSTLNCAILEGIERFERTEERFHCFR